MCPRWLPSFFITRILRNGSYLFSSIKGEFNALVDAVEVLGKYEVVLCQMTKEFTMNLSHRENFKCADKNIRSDKTWSLL